MKKLLGIVVLGLLICNISFADNFRVGQKIKNSLNISKNLKIKLSKGDWVVARNITDQWRGITQRIVGIARLENNEIMEMVEVYEGVLGGILIGDVNPILIELVFKNRHDGCYEKPEYFILEFYRKGSTHNCFRVAHWDLPKELTNPDDPESRGNAAEYNRWINDNSISVPKIVLVSDHSYFSRLVGGNWILVTHVANPKIYSAPKSNRLTEESSEYHKYNIGQFSEHNKVMQNWISIASKRHYSFENIIKVKDKHKLDLDIYIKDKINIDADIETSGSISVQIKQLNELYKSGALTKEEFTKAKKKLLN